MLFFAGRPVERCKADLDRYGAYRIPDDLDRQRWCGVRAHGQTHRPGNNIDVDGEFNEVTGSEVVGDDTTRNDPNRVR